MCANRVRATTSARMARIAAMASGVIQNSLCVHGIRDSINSKCLQQARSDTSAPCVDADYQDNFALDTTYDQQRSTSPRCFCAEPGSVRDDRAHIRWQKTELPGRNIRWPGGLS